MTTAQLDAAMRRVLMDLALTSNGASANYEGRSTGAGQASDVIPQLGAHDAPHLHWARVYARAGDDTERARALERAGDELDAIRHSRGDPSREETLEQLEARIVARGEGLTKKEVAVWARCTEKMVAAARRKAGRDEDRGRRPRDVTALTSEQRRAAILAEAASGRSARQIAVSMDGVSYSTVLRALGRKA